MNKMKKSVVAAGLTAGLLGGGAAGVILGSGGVSGAQESTTTVPAESTKPKEGTRPDRSARLAETLAPLVEDGTITQAQADKVIAALIAARGDGDGHGHGGRHGRGGHFGGEAAAAALGMSVDELRTALRDGQTIAQIAESKGVPIDEVIAAIVAERTKKIEEKVTAGELTREEADEKIASLTEKVTEQVNSAGPFRGGRAGEGPEGAPGDGPADAPAAPADPPAATPTTPPSTTPTTAPKSSTTTSTTVPSTTSTTEPADAPAGGD